MSSNFRLNTFTENDQSIFKGRKTLISTIVSAIQNQSTIYIYGQSGIGKSSLLEAGVRPQLRRIGYHPPKIDLTKSYKDGLADLIRSFLHEVKFRLADSEELTHLKGPIQKLYKLINELENEPPPLTSTAKFTEKLKEFKSSDTLNKILKILEASFKRAKEIEEKLDPEDKKFSLNTENLLFIILCDIAIHHRINLFEKLENEDINESKSNDNRLKDIIEAFNEQVKDNPFANPIVFIFDQFEEVFIQDKFDLESRSRFLKLLKPLIEFKPSPQKFRLVFSFREDYLADFMDFKDELLGYSETMKGFRVKGLKYKEALEVIKQGPSAFHTEKFQREILKSLIETESAKIASDENEEHFLKNYEYNPFLLSAVCLDLEEKKVNIVEGITNIKLGEFLYKNVYKQTIKVLSQEQRVYLLGHLLTAQGKKAFIPEEVINSNLLNFNIPYKDRNISFEEYALKETKLLTFRSGGYYELIHDQLAQKLSRDEFHQTYIEEFRSRNPVEPNSFPDSQVNFRFLIKSDLTEYKVVNFDRRLLQALKTLYPSQIIKGNSTTERRLEILNRAKIDKNYIQLDYEKIKVIQIKIQEKYSEYQTPEVEELFKPLIEGVEVSGAILLTLKVKKESPISESNKISNEQDTGFKLDDLDVYFFKDKSSEERSLKNIDSWYGFKELIKDEFKNQHATPNSGQKDPEFNITGSESKLEQYLDEIKTFSPNELNRLFNQIKKIREKKNKVLSYSSPENYSDQELNEIISELGDYNLFDSDGLLKEVIEKEGLITKLLSDLGPFKQIEERFDDKNDMNQLTTVINSLTIKHRFLEHLGNLKESLDTMRIILDDYLIRYPKAKDYDFLIEEMAQCYMNLGEIEIARGLFLMYVSHCEQNFNSNQGAYNSRMELINAYRSYADVEHEANNLLRAQNSLKKALVLSQAKTYLNDKNLALSGAYVKSSLAGYLDNLGEFKESKKLSSEADKLVDDSFSENHLFRVYQNIKRYRHKSKKLIFTQESDNLTEQSRIKGIIQALSTDRERLTKLLPAGHHIINRPYLDIFVFKAFMKVFNYDASYWEVGSMRQEIDALDENAKQTQYILDAEIWLCIKSILTDTKPNISPDRIKKAESEYPNHMLLVYYNLAYWNLNKKATYIENVISKMIKSGCPENSIVINKYKTLIS
ncbi:MAG: hypothetical protein HWE07_13915 [Cytophagia bacterium]|nr:hypothetical protein [Cytophagia bacterium]